jgi:hypothetical protein
MLPSLGLPHKLPGWPLPCSVILLLPQNDRLGALNPRLVDWRPPSCRQTCPTRVGITQASIQAHGTPQSSPPVKLAAGTHWLSAAHASCRARWLDDI